MIILVKNVSRDSVQELFWGNAPDVFNYLCGFSALDPDNIGYSFVPDLDDDSPYDVIVTIHSEYTLK